MALMKRAGTTAKKETTAKKPAHPKNRTASFRYYAPEAHHVALAGDFNNWAPDAQPMQKSNDGTWTATVKLKLGSCQYKFVVDGNWREDHANPARVQTQEGVVNSVMEIA